MKLLEFFDGILSEVGEGTSKVYDYDGFGDMAHTEYTFDTDSGLPYKIKIEHIEEALPEGYEDDYVVELAFKVEGGGFEDVTNRGEFFAVMATVVSTLKDYLNNYEANVVRIEPAKTGHEDDYRRFNIYMEYIKRSLPHRSIEVDDEDDIIYIRIN